MSSEGRARNIRPDARLFIFPEQLQTLGARYFQFMRDHCKRLKFRLSLLICGVLFFAHMNEYFQSH